MTSVQGIKEGITNGFKTIKTKAGNAYKNLGLGTILAGEYLKGLAQDTVQFAKAKPVKAGLIGLGAAAGIGAATKLVSIGVSKFKEHKEEKKLEAALNKQNAVIAAMAEPALKEAKAVIEYGAQIINAQQTEIDRLKELVKRVNDDNVREVIVATNPDVEGEATAVYIAKMLQERGRKNLTIITNSIEILIELFDAQDWTIISTGGASREGSFALVGPQTDKMLKSYHVDKAIVAENVKIGAGARLGVGEFAPSTYDPKVYQFDLVTIGENSVIPPGVQIGKNTAISGVTSIEDYDNGVLASGETLIKAGDRV